MNPLLEILIPYSPEHTMPALHLELDLKKQIIDLRTAAKFDFPHCIVTTTPDMFCNRGKIRNYMLENSVGEYVAFFDADDIPSKDYMKKTVTALISKPDCCSLTGVITWDGTNPEIFEHSIKYYAYKTNNTGKIKYERYPNHLNAIRSDIAKQFKFPEIDFGEDTNWATQIFKSGLLKKETRIDGVIYHYQYQNKI